jgi:hypothetical protein
MASAATRFRLSIHGNDKDGKNLGMRYNPSPEPQREPTTPRGKRRLEKSKQGKK